MNKETNHLIRKSNTIPNYTRSIKNDLIFFVLRSKTHTFVNSNTFEDVFCVVDDVYVNLINKNINTFATTQSQRKPSTAERINTCWDWQTLRISNGQTKANNYNSDIKASSSLKLFRDYLKLFDLHPNSSISYVDDNRTVHLVQTETEFLALWKFAQMYAVHKKGVLLLVDFTNNQDFNVINSNDKIATVNDEEILTVNGQKTLITDNANLPTNFQLKESAVVVNNTNVQNSNELLHRYPQFSSVVNTPVRYPKNPQQAYSKESHAAFNICSQDFLDKIPPLWFVLYMEEFKQDIIKEVSDKVMINVKKNLNEHNAQVEEAIKSAKKVYSHVSKNNGQMKHLFIDQKRRCKIVTKSRKKKEKKLEEKLEYNSEDDNIKVEANERYKKYNISKCVDNMNSICTSNKATNQNGTVNNDDFMPSDFLKSQRSSKENLHEPNAIEESKFRMKCSITENQTSDETNFTTKTCSCGSDIENISINSDISTGEETSTDCNFEMIQKPSSEEQHFCFKNEAKNSKAIPRFFKTFFPRQSTIRIDENHFTIDSNNLPTSSDNSDLNIPSFCKSNNEENCECDNVDINIFKPWPRKNYYEDTDVNELTHSICKSLIENSTNSTHKEINREAECSLANNLEANVNDSHTSYMTTKSINTDNSDCPVTQHSCQAQTDLNDLTQSFHSHTTSMADNGVYCIGETNTTTSHDYSKHSLSNSSKPTNSRENRTCKQVKKDISNEYPDKKMSKEESNAKTVKHVNEETPANSAQGTTETVHILPETLVNGALHLASFAYGTAREAVVKIRATSRNHRSSRQRPARF